MEIIVLVCCCLQCVITMVGGFYFGRFIIRYGFDKKFAIKYMGSLLVLLYILVGHVELLFVNNFEWPMRLITLIPVGIFMSMSLVSYIIYGCRKHFHSKKDTNLTPPKIDKDASPIQSKTETDNNEDSDLEINFTPGIQQYPFPRY